MNPKSRGSCPLLMDLPSEILVNILSRLPIRTILGCKCVCKPLLNLLSTPDFAASHFSLSNTPGLVIRQYTEEDDLCQIFEYEDEFELQHHNLHYKAVMDFNPSLSVGLSDVKLLIIGSVNGILCLQEHISEVYDALYLCNPITHEYISLPLIDGIVEFPDRYEYGFGVSRISRQYKVVRNVHRHSDDHQETSSQNSECLVYTVGSGSWRDIRPCRPFGDSRTLFDLFMNGNLHGLQDCGDSTNMLISCFDLETELFTPFPPAPPPIDSPAIGTLGILDDCLCFVDNSSQDADILFIWMMKEYGVKESWTKQFVVESQGYTGLFFDSIQLIKVFKDGDILFIYNNSMMFYLSYKTKTCKDLDLVTQDEHGWIEAIPHNSSFISLKSLDGENVELF